MHLIFFRHICHYSTPQLLETDVCRFDIGLTSFDSSVHNLESFSVHKTYSITHMKLSLPERKN